MPSLSGFNISKLAKSSTTATKNFGGTFLNAEGLGKKTVSNINASANKAADSYRQKIEFAYDPIDLVPYKAVGILLPFNKAVNSTAMIGNPTNPVNGGALYSTKANGAGVFRLSYTTDEQAISNLLMLLLTRKGERLYHPTFGTGLQDLVFEQNTDYIVDRVEAELTEAINFWLPYIIVNNVEIDNTDTFNEPGHSIRVELSFQVTEQGANQQIILIVSGETINIIQ